MFMPNVKMIFFVLTVVYFVVVTIGCSSTTYRTGAVKASSEATQQIVRGKTNTIDVEKILGDPSNTIKLKDGEEIWIYESSVVSHNSGKETAMAVPLINVLSFSADKSSRKVAKTESIKVRFIDKIVDEIISGQQEWTEDGLVKIKKEYESLMKRDQFERVEFTPVSHRTSLMEGSVDLWQFKGEYREVLLSFDLTKLGPQPKVRKAYLAMLPRTKKVAAKRIRPNRSDLYSPLVYLVGEDWSLAGRSFAARCFSSGCEYQLSPESLHRVVTDVFLPGMGRNIYVLSRSEWEYWDVTDLIIQNQQMQKVYLRASVSVGSDYVGNQYAAYAESLPPLCDYIENETGSTQSNVKLILLIPR